MTADDALAGLTKNAAAIAGVDRRLGTLEPGKLGHVIAMTGAVHRRAGQGQVRPDRRSEIRDQARGPGPDQVAGRAEPTAWPRRRTGRSPAARRTRRGRARLQSGRRRRTPRRREQESRAGPPRSKGQGSSRSTKQPADRQGPRHRQERSAGASRRPTTKATTPREARGCQGCRLQAADAKSEPESEGRSKSKTGSSQSADRQARDCQGSRPRLSTWPTELDEDRKPSIHTGGDVLIKDATILTVTKGTIAKGSILVEDGKIKAVGTGLTAPAGVTVIDAAGLVAMPGIIDTHSHIAIQGGVNEGSLSVVPEVRVKDVVTGDDIAIYRALAGGTTTARLLHGSANTIGGQDAVVKLRYGKPGRDLIIRDGPQGVKFALGENVTRSRGRFPNTRMGVESVIERAFDEARAYRPAWDDYRKRPRRPRAPAQLGPPPRVDLRLEALAGILDGSIKIHSHCYRSDEILMLLRTAQRYGVRVQSLQHVLEGYKVAAEIAAHGASASTFSDWWAYKIEAYDAIPYNAALLTEAGASVCIKSDDAELMRHLNLEAAKMVKYGGVSESPGPGDDHDQPGPRAGARWSRRLDRGGQGRRHRAL